VRLFNSRRHHELREREREREKERERKREREVEINKKRERERERQRDRERVKKREREREERERESENSNHLTACAAISSQITKEQASARTTRLIWSSSSTLGPALLMLPSIMLPPTNFLF
jgi:hypothetical protein